MKGHVETTIPQRQYENLKICYEFNTPEEKKEAIAEALADCRTYHNILSKIPDTKTTDSAKTTKINGVEWKMVDNVWSYLDPKTNKWTGPEKTKEK